MDVLRLVTICNSLMDVKLTLLWPSQWVAAAMSQGSSVNLYCSAFGNKSLFNSAANYGKLGNRSNIGMLGACRDLKQVEGQEMFVHCTFCVHAYVQSGVA